uniref:Uncharacterized protein n=1 Tax=Trichogramma kaykai TaxID=54128 RepID=A0ABD2X1A0_9HYME
MISESNGKGDDGYGYDDDDDDDDDDDCDARICVKRFNDYLALAYVYIRKNRTRVCVYYIKCKLIVKINPILNANLSINYFARRFFDFDCEYLPGSRARDCTIFSSWRHLNIRREPSSMDSYPFIKLSR